MLYFDEKIIFRLSKRLPRNPSTKLARLLSVLTQMPRRDALGSSAHDRSILHVHLQAKH